jgi:hypothetical protein
VAPGGVAVRLGHRPAEQNARHMLAVDVPRPGEPDVIMTKIRDLRGEG